MDTQMTLAQVAWKLGELASEGGCRYDAHDMSVMCSQMADAVNAELAKRAAEPVETKEAYRIGYAAGISSKPEQAMDYSAGIREAAARLRQACDFARIPCTPSSLSPLCQSAKFLESIVGIIDTNRLFPAEVVDGVGDRLRDAAVLLASFQSGFGSLKTYDGDEAATWDRIDRAIAAIFTTIEYLAGDCQTLDSVLPLPVIKSGGMLGPEYANGWNDCRDEILSNLRETATRSPAVATPTFTEAEQLGDIIYRINTYCLVGGLSDEDFRNNAQSLLEDIRGLLLSGVYEVATEFTPPQAVATPAEVTDGGADAIIRYLRTFEPIRQAFDVLGTDEREAIVERIAALAAQPSAVGVPEERKASLYPDESREDQAIGAAYDRGWNDCRKAILAAAPETTHD